MDEVSIFRRYRSLTNQITVFEVAMLQFTIDGTLMVYCGQQLIIFSSFHTYSTAYTTTQA